MTHSPLHQHVERLIATEGPIPISEFMALALYHPFHGYYRQQSAVGAGGDFITAPEISQMFGELIGLWCIQCWINMGQPTKFNLIELGPGRGILMADALRAAALSQPFLEAAQLQLVEVNQALQKDQHKNLRKIEPHISSVTWHERFDSIPEGPSIIVANEFFDCLPIRQFQRTEKGWCERMVGLDQNGQLCFQLSPDPIPPNFLNSLHLNSTAFGVAQLGHVLEYSPASQALATQIVERLNNQPGYALIIDYGDTVISQPTFQAVKNHQYHNPLENIGETDLTAHVNFAHLAKTTYENGAMVWGPISQSNFLTTLGIKQRAQMLMKASPSNIAEQIKNDLARLTAPDQMGDLFKAMVIAAPNLDAPPAFKNCQYAESGL